MVSTFYPKANNPPQRIGASLAQRAGLTLWTQPPGFPPDDIINFQVTAPRSIFPQQHIHHPGLQNKFMNYDYMFSQFEGSPGQWGRFQIGKAQVTSWRCCYRGLYPPPGWSCDWRREATPPRDPGMPGVTKKGQKSESKIAIMQNIYTYI